MTTFAMIFGVMLAVFAWAYLVMSIAMRNEDRAFKAGTKSIGFAIWMLGFVLPAAAAFATLLLEGVL